MLFYLTGRLRTQLHPNGEGELMPVTDEPEDGCREPKKAMGFKCFASGTLNIIYITHTKVVTTLWSVEDLNEATCYYTSVQKPYKRKMVLSTIN
jgi:hypothetical protein